MLRILLLLPALFTSTGCLISSGGYGHSSSGLKGPVTQILYSNDEPVVMLVVDGNCGLEVKQNGKNITGMFTVGDDQAILWYFEPTGPDYKQGSLWLGQGKALLPETTGWKSQHGLDTTQGNLILLRWNGSDYTVRQTQMDEKKLRAIAKEHRGGYGCQDITLESEKTWKIAAGSVQMTDFLQDSRNVGLEKEHPLRQYPGVTVNFEEYRQKEGMTKRGICFYMMAQAIEEVRRREPVTQGQVVSFLGEPDTVTEHFDLGKGTSRLVYEYRLIRGNVKGNVIALEFEQGRFTKFNFYPEPKME